MIDAMKSSGLWRWAALRMASKPLRDVRTEFLWTVVASLIALVSSVLVARALGPTGRGELALLQWLPALLVGVGNFGFAVSIMFYAARGMKHQELTYVSLASGGLLAACWLPVLAIGSVIWTRAKLGHFGWGLGLLSAAFLLLGILILFLNSQLRGQRDFFRVGLAAAIQSATYVAIIGALTLFATVTVAGAFSALLFSQTIQVALLIKFLLTGGIRKPVGTAVRPMISYGLKSWMLTIVSQMESQANVFLLALLSDTHEIGIFATSTTVCVGTCLLNKAVLAISFPHITKRAAAGGDRAAAVFSAKLAGLAILSIVPIFLAVLLFGRPVINGLYGAKFAPVYTVLLILIASRALNDAALILAGYVRAVVSPIAALPGLATMLLGKVLFVLWFPAAGAPVLASGVLVSAVIGCLLFGVQVYRAMGRTPQSAPAVDDSQTSSVGVDPESGV